MFKVIYNEDLRTTCIHLKSNSIIETDAPTDNNGKGQRFSPTDLVSVSLASCMLTIAGIYCQQNQITFKNITTRIEKIMTNTPRRIQEINIEIELKEKFTNEIIEKLKERMLKCPVAESIHPDIKVQLNIV